MILTNRHRSFRVLGKMGKTQLRTQRRAQEFDQKPGLSNYSAPRRSSDQGGGRLLSAVSRPADLIYLIDKISPFDEQGVPLSHWRKSGHYETTHCRRASRFASLLLDLSDYLIGFRWRPVPHAMAIFTFKPTVCPLTVDAVNKNRPGSTWAIQRVSRTRAGRTPGVLGSSELLR